MSEELDRIWRSADEPPVAADAESVEQRRLERVSGFKLELELNDDFGGIRKPETVEPDKPAAPEPAPSVSRAPEPPVAFRRVSPPVPAPPPVESAAAKKQRGNKKAHKTAWLWTRAFIYVVAVITTSAILIYFGVTGAIDLMGFDKSEIPVKVSITEEQSKDTGAIARVLKENGVINQPLIFRLYCWFTNVGDFHQNDGVMLKPSMGYEAVINALRTVDTTTVSVMFQEGMTAKDIAAKLEDSGVCGADEFIATLNKGGFTQSFLTEIPDGGEYEHRYQRYEGFLFPDTYQFYLGESPVSVANKFFNAFNTKVNINLRIKMKVEGLESVYKTITLASIIEWESSEGEMNRISRVLHNRIFKPTDNRRLQCDSSYRYLDQFVPLVDGKRQTDNESYKYYDTYQRDGLPVSPICNPGLNAIMAALEPSNDASVKNCYYFATDLDTGDTYFSTTYAQHVNTCKKYGIGYHAG